MWKTNLVVALRVLWRDKLVAATNVTGLSTAMAVCMLALLFVRHETAFDAWHTKADRLYVFVKETPDGQRSTMLSQAARAAVRDGVAGIANASYVGLGWVACQIGDETFDESVYAVDPSFLEMLTYPLAAGAAATALGRPDGVVLTAGLARRFYGDRDPTGSTIRIDGAERVVTGVLAPTPATTSLYFQMLVPTDAGTETGRQFNSTYGLIVERAAGAHEKEISAGVAAVLAEHLGSSKALLVPLRQVHDTPVDMAPIAFGRGKPGYAHILLGIATFVLAIACINYAILAMARAAVRLPEIGVRKAMGAGRRQLTTQFCAEAGLVTLVAAAGGVALAKVLLPSFNAVTGVATELVPTSGVLLGGAGLTVTMALLAGLYPAVAIAWQSPKTSLRGAVNLGGRQRTGRLLVIVQFALTTVLVIAVTAMHRQTDLMRSRDPGFDGDRVLYASAGVDAALLTRLADEVRSARSVQAVAGVFGLPGFGSGEVSVETTQTKLAARATYVSPGAASALGLRFASGRDFDVGSASDRDGIILNETAARALGVTVGDQVTAYTLGDMASAEVSVVGVVEDFHYSSMRQAVGPAFVRLMRDGTIPFHKEVRYPFLVARIDPAHVARAREELAAAWRRAGGGETLDTRRLGDHFASYYEAEERWQLAIGVAGAMALAIACMGLFGLATLSAQRRVREVGIRKVLGATTAGVLTLMSRELAWLVAMGNVLAWPAAWWVLERWLEHYAYRIELGPTLFVPAATVVLGVALLTVASQTWRAALSNPVDALRCE